MKSFVDLLSATNLRKLAFKLIKLIGQTASLPILVVAAPYESEVGSEQVSLGSALKR
jgi:hypothetical protein